MSAEPYIGEIIIFCGNFAPRGFAFCDGQSIPISQNEALFALIGTTFGGDGETTFALPDLRGRLPMHLGAGAGLPSFAMGETVGSEQVTLTTNSLPTHSHILRVSRTPGDKQSPMDHTLSAEMAGVSVPYSNQAPSARMRPGLVGPSGGGYQPHENLMPSAAVHFVIALEGVFPPQN